ncbi:MEDS domain-containing protein [Candidatus Omnitrophota bacterium]
MSEESGNKTIDITKYSPPNRHTCLFYSSKDELLDILAPYFKAGLENNEFCLWVVPDDWKTKEAKMALSKTVKDLEVYIEKGQMVIGDYKEYYLRSGAFGAFKMLEYWAKREKEVLGQGFNEIRISADGGWALGEYWITLNLYEKEVNRIIDEHRMIAICTYFINKLELQQISDIGMSHQSALVKRMGQWNSLEPSDFSTMKF